MVISVGKVGAVHHCPRAFICPYNPSVNMSDHNVKWRLAEFVRKILTTSVGHSYIAG